MEEFDGILQQATEAIDSSYFELAVYGQEGVSRERVYCYELYHQMRCRWPKDTRLSVMAEIDKQGHAELLHRGVRGASPDFLVHQPGSMEHNFCIMEVKCRHNVDGGTKDIRTVNAFLGFLEYTRGIIFEFGASSEESIEFWCRVGHEEPPHQNIELWCHERSGWPAICLGKLSDLI